jgi:hypothetical protein
LNKKEVNCEAHNYRRSYTLESCWKAQYVSTAVHNLHKPSFVCIIMCIIIYFRGLVKHRVGKCYIKQGIYTRWLNHMAINNDLMHSLYVTWLIGDTEGYYMHDSCFTKKTDMGGRLHSSQTWKTTRLVSCIAKPVNLHKSVQKKHNWVPNQSFSS